MNIPQLRSALSDAQAALYRGKFTGPIHAALAGIAVTVLSNRLRAALHEQAHPRQCMTVAQIFDKLHRAGVDVGVNGVVLAGAK